MTILATMITRNEARRYLDQTVPAILEVADWLLVVDDGSEDGTDDYLRTFDRVIVRRCQRSLWDRRGEGALRNHLLNLTFRWEPTPEWVISLDADELIADPQRLRGFLENVAPSDLEAVSMTMREVWDRTAVAGSNHGPYWLERVDGGWAPRECPIIWKPPRDASQLTNVERWQQAWTIPEQAVACGREPEIIRMVDALPSGCDLLHLGWSDPSERQARFARYMAIDGGRFHDSEHLRSILEPPTLEPYPVPSTWRR